MENKETKFTTAQTAMEDLKKNNEPNILREVKYWNGEAVITKLTEEDRAQLFFRQGNLISELLRNILITGVDIQIILMEIAKKQGINVDEILNKTQIQNTQNTETLNKTNSKTNTNKTNKQKKK